MKQNTQIDRKGLGKVKALKMIGMNGMKNVKLEPLIVGMAANGLLVADGLIGRWHQGWIERRNGRNRGRG